MCSHINYITCSDPNEAAALLCGIHVSNISPKKKKKAALLPPFSAGVVIVVRLEVTLCVISKMNRNRPGFCWIMMHFLLSQDNEMQTIQHSNWV